MTDTKKPKPRKLGVFTFKEACKALRKALDEIDQHKATGEELVKKCDQLREAHRVEASARTNAQADAKAARAEHDDLKKRLLNSELECARLRGYMERVREDDLVADPLPSGLLLAVVGGQQGQRGELPQPRPGEQRVVNRRRHPGDLRKSIVVDGEP